MIALDACGSDLRSLDPAMLFQISVVLLDPPGEMRIVLALGLVHLDVAGGPLLAALRVPVRRHYPEDAYEP